MTTNVKNMSQDSSLSLIENTARIEIENNMLCKQVLHLLA